MAFAVGKDERISGIIRKLLGSLLGIGKEPRTDDQNKRPYPPRCDSKIFKEGSSVALVCGSSWQVEEWVREVARRSEAKVDWHYSGGIAQVLHLGDVQSRERVHRIMRKLEKRLDKGGYVMRYVGEGERGMYRDGDENNPLAGVPDSAVAMSMGPLSGRQEWYCVSENSNEQQGD